MICFLLNIKNRRIPMTNSDEMRRAIALLESAFIQPVAEREDDDMDPEHNELTTYDAARKINDMVRRNMDDQHDGDVLTIERLSQIMETHGMSYFEITDQHGSEWQVQVHLKSRGRHMESVEEDTEISDVWLSDVADEVFTFEGVDQLDYSENDMKEMIGSLIQRGAITADMSVDAAATVVAQMLLQA
jgi:hypothetical protein